MAYPPNARAGSFATDLVPPGDHLDGVITESDIADPAGLPKAAAQLILAIKTAMQYARAGTARMDPRLVAIPGMSGRRYRAFINNLVSVVPNCHYLEVGSWAGSTLCAAINRNEIRATAIDDWSQFGGPKEKFREHLAMFQTPRAYVNFIEADFRRVPYDRLGPFNIYLFDGPHEKQDQFDGLHLAMPALDQTFVFIVDDWNWSAVREGTDEAITKCGLTTHYTFELRTTVDDTQPEQRAQNSDWHNGYFIGVLSKPG